MAEEITEKAQGLFLKIGQFIKQSPLIAICIWLCYRDIKREQKEDQRQIRQEKRDEERERFDKDQLIYYRSAKQEELRLKEKELNMKYEKDTIK